MKTQRLFFSFQKGYPGHQTFKALVNSIPIKHSLKLEITLALVLTSFSFLSRNNPKSKISEKKGFSNCDLSKLKNYLKPSSLNKNFTRDPPTFSESQFCVNRPYVSEHPFAKMKSTYLFFPNILYTFELKSILFSSENIQYWKSLFLHESFLRTILLVNFIERRQKNDLLEGDIKISEYNKPGRRMAADKRNARRYREYLWLDKVVPYEFYNNDFSTAIFYIFVSLS